jgi:hypothetical protein
MKYLRTVKGCTRLSQIRNEDIRNELGISPLSEKIIKYGVNGKHICKEWNIPPFHYRHINNQPSGKRDIDQEGDGERDNNTRGRNRRFS